MSTPGTEPGQPARAPRRSVQAFNPRSVMSPDNLGRLATKFSIVAHRPYEPILFLKPHRLRISGGLASVEPRPQCMSCPVNEPQRQLIEFPFARVLAT